MPVNFGTVHFHIHDLKLGDNPSVSSGLPVCMSWKAYHSEVLDLRAYEEERSNQRKRPRRLSKKERDAIVFARHTKTSARLVYDDIRRIKESRRASKKSKADHATFFMDLFRCNQRNESHRGLRKRPYWPVSSFLAQLR